MCRRRRRSRARWRARRRPGRSQSAPSVGRVAVRVPRARGPRSAASRRSRGRDRPTRPPTRRDLRRARTRMSTICWGGGVSKSRVVRGALADHLEVALGLDDARVERYGVDAVFSELLGHVGDEAVGGRFPDAVGHVEGVRLSAEARDQRDQRPRLARARRLDQQRTRRAAQSVRAACSTTPHSRLSKSARPDTRALSTFLSHLFQGG